MSINDQIERAKLEAFRKWDEGHKNCDFGSPERGQGMRDGFGDGFEVGYRAALRSLYVEVKPEECAEYGAYWIEVDGDCWEATFRKDKTGDYFDIKDVVSNSEVEIECVGKVYRLSIPSPAEAFGEGV